MRYDSPSASGLNKAIPIGGDAALKVLWDEHEVADLEFDSDDECKNEIPEPENAPEKSSVIRGLLGSLLGLSSAEVEDLLEYVKLIRKRRRNCKPKSPLDSIF